ncbi:MAG TPA: hypothetical protein VFW92_04750 [Candidatus Limnocylindrales bacterium]|nr:hypothetical protein [Candidatus Limnocylindrales bacterium]
MLQVLREMPGGVRVFLIYGLLILAFLGLTLPLIVNQAVETPVTILGLVWMALLAYLIFTITLVLQRKQAAYGLSMGLATLTIPLIPLLALAAGVVGGIFALALAVLIFTSLRRSSSRAWFSEL